MSKYCKLLDQGVSSFKSQREETPFIEKGSLKTIPLSLVMDQEMLFSLLNNATPHIRGAYYHFPHTRLPYEALLHIIPLSVRSLETILLES